MGKGSHPIRVDHTSCLQVDIKTHSFNELVIDEIRNNTSSHNFLSTVVRQNSSSCVKIPLRCSPSWVETTNEIGKICLFFFLSYCLRDGLVTSNYFGEGNLSRTSFYVVTLVREKTDTIPTERNLVFDRSTPSTIISTENVQDTWVRVCGSRVCTQNLSVWQHQEWQGFCDFNLGTCLVSVCVF